MKISTITNQNFIKKDTSFKGYTSRFAKRIYIDGQKDIEIMMKQNPNVKPIVGQLPPYIFNKIPKELRKTAIPEIMHVFDEVTSILREYTPDPSVFIFDETERNRPKIVNDMLTNVFQKYGILKSYEDINLEWLGKGGRGKAYKITGIYDPADEDQYVLKVFHQIKSDEWHPFKSHGFYAELNSATYWCKQEGMDTHRGKFYFGSLGTGYMVTKFLDEDTRLPKRIVPEYKYGIKCTDEKKSKSKTSYEQDYNYVKDYNFDFGGMRIVNYLKNTCKPARKEMEKIKKLSEEKKASYWIGNFYKRQNTEGRLAGFALGIKYLDKKDLFINECLKLKKPKINQAIAYVLKYLDYESALKYFKILVQTNDAETQRVLFNEIPLLAKRKDETTEIADDIHVALQEIIPERIYEYYMLAEEFALPETVEHLASYVHLLPKNKIKQQYRKLTNIDNIPLQERLIWKLNFLPNEMQEYARVRLSEKIKDPILQQRLLRASKSMPNNILQEILQNIENNKVNNL